MHAISEATSITPPARTADLALALEHHMAGRFDDAAALYQRLHAFDPRDSEVIFLMGVLCQDLGLFEAACRFLEEALALTPQFPEAQAQLIKALDAGANLDICAGKLTAAERSLQRARQLAPQDAAAPRGLARIALLAGNAAVAEARFLESLALCPDHVETLNELGLAQLRLEKYPAAEASLRRVLELRPDHDQARNNLGLVLYQLGRLEEARTYFEETLARDPTYRNARINWAVTMRVLGHLDAASAALTAILAAHPDDIEALNNLGVVYQDMGAADLAMTTLSRAFAVAPQSAQVRWNFALTSLLHGDYRRGWELYEARWEGCDHLRGGYRFPATRAWRGEDLRGKRLLLWWEQGFGDTLQFIRFAQDLAAAGASVHAVVQRELTRVVQRAKGVSAVHAHEDALPSYDFHCPLMSLPLRLGVRLDAAELHGNAAYVTSEPALTGQWSERLVGYPGLKVGLVWAGNARRQTPELRAVDQRRSIALARLAPLLAVEGCSFFSLQKGEGAGELQAYREQLPPTAGTTAPIHDFTTEWSDFADTAAFVANLDLIITVDTAVAHLAGALGKPVWLLNRYDTCWRWLCDRTDSPWYGQLRQIRQTRWGDWDPVIADAAAALAESIPRRD